MNVSIKVILIALFGALTLTACNTASQNIQGQAVSTGITALPSTAGDQTTVYLPSQSREPLQTAGPEQQDMPSPRLRHRWQLAEGSFPLLPDYQWEASSSPATPPAPAPPLTLPEEVEVVVLLGTDNFAPYAGRTDTIQIAFLNHRTRNLSLVSIPRDMYVYLPGHGMDRINTAYVIGGVDLVFETFEYNFGLQPHHWVLAHLDDFIRVVDDLGGIEVEVSTPLPNDCGGIPLGTVHMDGTTALCYARSRMGTSDFDRSRRQQEMLQTIFRRAMSLDVAAQLPEWYSRYSETIHTDLAPTDLLSYVPLALNLYLDGTIHTFQLSWKDVDDFRVPETGADVVVAHPGRVQEIIQQAIESLEP